MYFLVTYPNFMSPPLATLLVDNPHLSERLRSVVVETHDAVLEQ